MDTQLRKQAIALYDRFTHEGLDRRVFMARMVALAGSVAAAEAMIGAIAATPAAAAIVPADDKRLVARTQDLVGGYKAYVAEPRSRSLKPTVLVIHENRGLNDHIRDIARRLAVAGFRAVAPDFLSLSGGTPANEDAAREAIGKLDLAKSVNDAVAMLDELARSSRGGKVGSVGFCWGGGFVNRLAVAAGDKLAAGVSFYGSAPDASEASKVQAPLLIHDAGLDDRVNRTSFPWVDALRAVGKPVKFYLYEGVNHAFNNDTSAERYDKAAADLAWKRTIAFFKQHLG
ncbi:dienelactone hydrolase family protein [Sphingomonas daechungensis]|uniref:Dienelactone hydrolase family protein n=1 Tax=Sphingomonas daechungensis TaxID=1176646 RepID=A0ABX6T0Y7_9SPHN|nr:dienelactone hydrolase family protein [Sphingomonas daechungensis]QNP43502.1 dienelactone hydrolase family protein [Sphingomonas daechungensis]